MEERLARIEEKLDTILKSVSAMTRVLYGRNGHPGILVRMDRLEQTCKRQSTIMKIVFGAFVAAAASGVIGWLV